MNQAPGNGGIPTASDAPGNGDIPTASDAPELDNGVREADEIVSEAMSSPQTRPKRVGSSDDLALYDPITAPQTANGNADNGVNIINSFVNRTVFFDYFRHVAHKRFPELKGAERVQKLVDIEPKFYRRSILSDYVLKVVTSLAIIGVAACLVVKALFW